MSLLRAVAVVFGVLVLVHEPPRPGDSVLRFKRVAAENAVHSEPENGRLANIVLVREGRVCDKGRPRIAGAGWRWEFAHRYEHSTERYASMIGTDGPKALRAARRAFHFDT
jgi:hypothetical protein